MEPNPFFEPEALLPAVALLADGPAVRLLVVEDEQGELLVLLPVVRRRGGPGRAVLSTWQHPLCYSGTALVAPSAGSPAWDAARAVLRAAGARVLVLHRWHTDGPAARCLGHDPRARAVRQHDRPVVLRRPEPTYLDDRLGRRSRKALRRQARRLAEALGQQPQLVDLAREGRGAEGVERYLAVEAAGWKGRAGTALACDERTAALLRRLCGAFEAGGRLQVWALGVPDRTAAVQVNLVAADTVFHLKTTYDEELAGTSPGLQLEVALVQEFHRDEHLQVLDSCTDPGPTVSERLYPDRFALATLLVPLDGAAGLAVRAAAGAFRLARTGAGGRRRSTGRDRPPAPTGDEA